MSAVAKLAKENRRSDLLANKLICAGSDAYPRSYTRLLSEGQIQSNRCLDVLRHDHRRPASTDALGTGLGDSAHTALPRFPASRGSEETGKRGLATT
jgi:hypothetical protein